MAEMGAHSALSGAIAIIIYRISFFPLAVNTLVILVVSLLAHFFLDLFPHGHTKKIWKEMISGAVIIPIIVVISIWRGGIELLFLSMVAIFFGNLFDGLLVVARKLEKMSGWLQKLGTKIIELNLWIHWFVRSDTFMAKWDVRQKISVEKWKEKPVYSWRYGWYNGIPLIISLIVLCWSLAF